VEVVERAPTVGGLAGTVRFQGLPCDLGSHRLHPEGLRGPILSELASEGLFLRRPRRGRLLFGGHAVPYPPRVLPFARALGARRTLATAAHVLLRAPRSRWETRRIDEVDVGFERFVLGRVGPAAYEAFYRPYAVKVWGVPPDQLSQTVAKKRVSTSSPLRALRGGAFMYPRDGIGALAERLVDRLGRRGVTIRTGCVAEIGDHRGPVLWSAPLSGLVPTGLRQLGLHLVHLALPLPRVSTVDTWYAPEGRFWFGRVSELGNFSPTLRRADESILCVEIPQGAFPERHRFTSQRLRSLLRQLVTAGILPAGVQPTAVRQTFLPGVYPLYLRGWRDLWRQAMTGVAALGNVYPFGRQGLFLHCNLDHCAVIAARLVEHLEQGRSARSWADTADRFLGVRVRD